MWAIQFSLLFIITTPKNLVSLTLVINLPSMNIDLDSSSRLANGLVRTQVPLYSEAALKWID